MENLLQGRTAVIFGVANKRSIAWAIAQKMDEAGANLAITYQNERMRQEAQDIIASLPNATAFQCDVSNDAEIEQLAMSPSNFVPGIGASPDKMLQARIFSYADAHRYRLGTHYEALPVNSPKCPVHHYHKDGSMNFFGQKTGKGFYDWSKKDAEAVKARRDQFVLNFLKSAANERKFASESREGEWHSP